MKNELGLQIQKFFQDYLLNERELGRHTYYSYRDTVKLFLAYLQGEIGRRPVGLNDLTAVKVISFLEMLKKKRGNGVKTQNQRLAALKHLFQYLKNNDPTRMNQYERIDHINFKRAPRVPIEYLEKKEVDAIMACINQQTLKGRRDYGMLLLLYNSGARVQEICDLKKKDIQWSNPYMVKLKGKGNKTRHVPLWKKTVEALSYVVKGKEENNFIFGKNEMALTRFGIRYIILKYVEAAIKDCPTLKSKRIGPHTFRHTTAMHLLQSGVDITVIKNWLGHVDLNTTHGYIEIDMKMKKEAMKKLKPTNEQVEEDLLKKHGDIVSWLSSL